MLKRDRIIAYRKKACIGARAVEPDMDNRSWESGRDYAARGGGRVTDSIVQSRFWQADRYPVQCRACGQSSCLVLNWNAAGEVRREWLGVEKGRVNLRQPRVSSGQCAACGSSDLSIGHAEII